VKVSHEIPRTPTPEMKLEGAGLVDVVVVAVVAVVVVTIVVGATVVVNEIGVLIGVEVLLLGVLL